ncbi:MAG: hypothetical protein MRY21_07015 [Simkaniaceae bacterium]|nr:hypothetical protein [Simkaniaceae bacterium]
MSRVHTSRRRAKAISSAIFFIGLAIIAFRFNWWPAILVPIGISLAVRQYLLGRYRDMTLSLVIFIGAFVTSQFNVSWEIILPIIFVISAIYILAREFLEPTNEVESEEDLNDEISEDQK